MKDLSYSSGERGFNNPGKIKVVKKNCAGKLMKFIFFSVEKFSNSRIFSRIQKEILKDSEQNIYFNLLFTEIGKNTKHW